MRFSRWFGLFFLLTIAVAMVRFWVVGQSYDSSLGINLLVVSNDSMAVLAVRKDEDLLVWLPLPNELKVPVPQLSGAQYQIGSLWGLGEIEKKILTLPKDAVGEALGVKIVATVHYSGELDIGSLVSSLLSPAVKTDLDWGSRLRLRQDLSALIGDNKMIEIALPNQIIDEVEEADGKRFYKFNSAVFNWSLDQWVSEKVLSEMPSAVLINSSGIEGRGLIISRQIESLGVRVLEVNSGEVINDHSGCGYKLNVNKRLTKEVINNYFGCKYLGDLSEEEMKNSYGANMIFWVTNKN